MTTNSTNLLKKPKDACLLYKWTVKEFSLTSSVPTYSRLPKFILHKVNHMQSKNWSILTHVIRRRRVSPTANHLTQLSSQISGSIICEIDPNFNVFNDIGFSATINTITYSLTITKQLYNKFAIELKGNQINWSYNPTSVQIVLLTEIQDSRLRSLNNNAVQFTLFTQVIEIRNATMKF
jgi:hypothetical protein